MSQYVRNPDTGKLIKVGGRAYKRVYKRFLSMGHVGRGKDTKYTFHTKGADDIWCVNTPLKDVTTDTAALYPISLSWGQNTLVAKPNNDSNPHKPPLSVGVHDLPPKIGLYLYIVITMKPSKAIASKRPRRTQSLPTHRWRTRTEQTILVWTKVHSPLEYRSTHTHLVIWAKDKYNDNVRLRMAGEMRRSKGGKIDINACSYLHRVCMSDSKKKGVIASMKKLCDHDVGFIDKCFPPPNMSMNRFDTCSDLVGGFTLFRSAEDMDRYNKLRMNTVHSHFEIQKNESIMRRVKNKYSEVFEAKIVEAKKELAYIEKKMCELVLGTVYSSKDVYKLLSK